MLADVLTHYGADLTHTREYGWVSVRCPFTENHSHDDRTASARVNLEKGGFTCLACAIKGDAIKLVMTREGLGYLDAVDFIEALSGTRVEGVSRAAPKPRQRSRWRQTLFD